MINKYMSYLLELFCPWCNIPYCKECFQQRLETVNYCICKFEFHIVFIKKHVSPEFYSKYINRLVDSFVNEDFKRMPNTQIYVQSVLNIKRNKLHIKTIQQEIKRLQEALFELKEDQIQHELKLCTINTNRYIHKCKVDLCRGYVSNFNTCDLCLHICGCEICESTENKTTESTENKTTESTEKTTESTEKTTESTENEVHFTFPNFEINDKRWNHILHVYHTIYPTLIKDYLFDIRIQFLSNEITFAEYELATKKVYEKKQSDIFYKDCLVMYFKFIELNYKHENFWEKEETIKKEINEWITELKRNPI